MKTLLQSVRKRFCKSSDGNSTEQCSICLDGDNDSFLTKLSCGHTFHEPCINKWLQDNPRGCSKSTCPLCRADAPILSRPQAELVCDSVGKKNVVFSVGTELVFFDTPGSVLLSTGVRGQRGGSPYSQDRVRI